jgi:hypothetical protein
MAQKNNGNGQTAGKRLQALRDQLLALLRRKEELAAVEGRPDLDDPAGWVEKAKKAAGERAALERIIPALTTQAEAAEAQLAEMRKEETLAAAIAAQAGLAPRLADVVKAIDALGPALDALAGQEALCKALGGWCPQTPAGILRGALGAFRWQMRRDWPELVGLPPKLTPHEQTRQMLKAELVSAEQDLRNARAAKPVPLNMDRSAAEDREELKGIDRANSASHSAARAAEPRWNERMADCEREVKRRRRRLLEYENPDTAHEETDVVKKALNMARRSGMRLDDAIDSLREQEAIAERQAAAEGPTGEDYD